MNIVGIAGSTFLAAILTFNAFAQSRPSQSVAQLPPNAVKVQPNVARPAESEVRTRLPPNVAFKALPANPAARANLEIYKLRPDQVGQLPGAVAPPRPTGDGATRSVLADGTLVVTFDDGSQRRQRPDGSVQMVAPDGTIVVPMKTMSTQVESAEMPALPGSLQKWGNDLNYRLSDILKSILTPAELAAYSQTEAGKDYYKLVDWRVQSIQLLTSSPQ